MKDMTIIDTKMEEDYQISIGYREISLSELKQFIDDYNVRLYIWFSNHGVIYIDTGYSDYNLIEFILKGSNFKNITEILNIGSLMMDPNGDYAGNYLFRTNEKLTDDMYSALQDMRENSFQWK